MSTGCTCNPKKMASRGRCAIHGFKADPLVALRKQIVKMTAHQLADEVLGLASDQVEHGYEDSDRTRLRILIEVARGRLIPKPRRK